MAFLKAGQSGVIIDENGNKIVDENGNGFSIGSGSFILRANRKILKAGGGGGDTVVIGGREYRTVTIGNRVWLAENLMLSWTGLSKTNNGQWVESPSYTTKDEYPDTFYYNDLAITDLVTNHADLIPVGWRIPTEADFLYLKSNVNHLAIKSITGWNPPGTNELGLNIFPVGQFGAGGWGNTNGTDVRTAVSYNYFRIENSAPYLRMISWGHGYHHYNSVRLVKDA